MNTGNLLILALGALAISGCEPRPEASEAPKGSGNVPQDVLPAVVVPFLGATRDVKGLELPEAIHGPGVSAFDLPERCDLTILVPGRRPIRVRAKRMTILTGNGLIEGIYIWRPFQPMGYKVVVADMLQTLKDQGLEPGKVMKKHLSEFPDDQPNPQGHFFPVPYRANDLNAFGEIGTIGVDVAPYVGGGWFYSVEFGFNLKASFATRITNPDSPEQQAVIVRGPDVGRLSGEPTSNDHPIPLHGASLHLPGTAREIKGIDVPLPLLAGKSGTAQFARPHALTIERPHGKLLSLLARKTSVTIRDGAVQEVTLIRPTLSAPFRKAIEDIVDAVEAEDAEPAAAKALIADWSEASGTREFKTTLRGVFEEMEADVHMAKDAATGNWSYTMTFRPAPAQKPSVPVAEKPAQPLKGRVRRALPAVSVHLPGPARQVEGVSVPAGILAGQPGRVEVDHPCDLTVIRANNQPMWMPMRGATLAFRDGRVESVTAHRPYMPLPLEKAITDLESVARGLRIDIKWNFEPRVRMWLRQAGAPEFVTKYPGVPEGLDLEVRLKRVGDVDQWTYTLTFRAAAGLDPP